MDNHIPQINGDLLRMRREELGWAVVDLATRACLSKKQVKQIEEGGTSSFYSDTVKMTAAKKIGGILGLPEQSVFVVEEPEVVPEELASQYDSLSPTSDELIAEHANSASQKPVVEVAASFGLDSPNSNASQVSPVSPVSQVEIASPAVKPYLKSPSLETTVIQKSTNSALDSEDKPKSKNSLWFIIALFVAALGFAAVMQKPATPPPAEPPPPIQVLPPEPVAPVASPAQVASSAASIPSAATGTGATSALPAPRPSVVYSSPSSVPSTAPAPAGSVAPAATASQAAPAAPSASKPQ